LRRTRSRRLRATNSRSATSSTAARGIATTAGAATATVAVPASAKQSGPVWSDPTRRSSAADIPMKAQLCGGPEASSLPARCYSGESQDTARAHTPHPHRERRRKRADRRRSSSLHGPRRALAAGARSRPRQDLRWKLTPDSRNEQRRGRPFQAGAGPVSAPWFWQLIRDIIRR
jgi:hypothetical protein